MGGAALAAQRLKSFLFGAQKALPHPYVADREVENRLLLLAFRRR
jgi:hypothetical protein